MAFARVYSAQIDILSGKIVSVEVDTSRGLNSFTIVGLADRAVDEARDRVGSALKNSNFESPKSKNQKTVVSLAPADLKKEGSHFDVPIAIGYLATCGMEFANLDTTLFIGELGLNGALVPVRGVLPIALAAKEAGFTSMIVPKENTREALHAEGLSIYGADTLGAIVSHLQGTRLLTPALPDTAAHATQEHAADFKDIIGQESAKRALVLAAAGGHNILMYGPPGTGKTMLARALASILPELSHEEKVAVTSIHSIAGQVRDLIEEPPFRAPHHTASYVSVIGGGSTPRPGEVTLAHHGVLFLDEFPEFDRRVIESLREPLEEHFISIARSKGSAVFPTHFLFVAAMNPCPCGYKGSRIKECSCSAADLVRYKRKLSGPLLDRIDIAIYVGELPYEKLQSQGTSTPSCVLREEVSRARRKAITRAKAAHISARSNGELRSKDLPLCATLSPEAEKVLTESATRLGLSARSYHRTQKLARTIADLAESEHILPEHILEAVRYRPQFE